MREKATTRKKRGGIYADFQACLKALYLSMTTQKVVILSWGTPGLRLDEATRTYRMDPSHKMIMLAGKAWDTWSISPHDFSHWEAKLVYDYAKAARSLNLVEGIDLEKASQLLHTHSGCRQMIAGLNLANMSSGKEPQYTWGRCTKAGWAGEFHSTCRLASAEPKVLPYRDYESLYQAIQAARSAQFF